MNAKSDFVTEIEDFSAMWMLAAAVIMVAACGWAMWQTRTQYRLPNGGLWDAAYPAVIAPPECLPLQIRRSRPFPSGLALGTMCASLLLFAAAVAQVLVQG